MKFSDGLQEIPCVFLAMLPLELRQMVYRELLVCNIISRPEKLVQQRQDTLIVPGRRDHAGMEGIDAKLLRTCRIIYREGLPILYGENRFLFSSPHGLEKFRREGLPKCRTLMNRLLLLDHLDITMFNFCGEPQGRLSLIRKLSLVLAYEDFHGYRPSRALIMSVWTRFLQDRPTNGSWVRDTVEFPALQELLLDFSDWCLGANEGIVVGASMSRNLTTD